MIVFEHPIVVAILGLFVLAFFLARWIFTKEPAHGSTLGIAAFIISALVMVNLLVVTPRESIVAVAKSLGRSVDDGDVAAIGSRLAQDFSAGKLDRQEFLDRAASTLTRSRVDHVRLHRWDVQVHDSNSATATFDARCNIRTAEGFAGSVPSRWRLQFVLRDDQWLVRRIESIPVPPLHLKTEEVLNQ